ncbi:ribonucleoside-diphosphate reductase subunit alpha [Candidatus Woesearchaeota archaeon]|nr:ribonucleoside-diphosphate reductase subunit alpha [Candidatus Woesearchaeota archaeon]
MAELKVVKRTGEVVDFDIERIRNAIRKAVKAVGEPVPEEKIDLMVRDISDEVSRRFIDFHANVENIQDIVEKHLVKHGLYEIAKAYIIYRADRQRVREEQKQRMVEKAKLGRLTVKKRDGRTVLFDLNKVRHTIERVSQGYEKSIDPGLISRELIKNIYDGVSSEEIEKALILATVPFIEKDPAYSKVAARLYQQRIYKEVIGRSISPELLDIAYRDAFISGLKKTAASGMMDARMLEFDLRKLSEGLRTERDDLFEYLGLQTLYERYFIKIEEKRIELPQAFWMRVAMGLALLEGEKEKRALEFYEVLSTLRFVSSTPTLFHSGLTRPQLSSCYLTTVEDDLTHIFKSLGDHAQLSKWSGGLGNDWTPIRSTGAHIKSTNVESQGVIPFLKIANDVTVAINRSGKRRGATCAYLETWHLDIEDFLDLRRNTGDERRRTHDMNTANWVPDLFMKRVLENGKWTLFSPDEAKDLHDLYGRKFEERYAHYEQMALRGGIKKVKTVEAQKLWRKMLTMLFETGHPWITFKDPCNIRSPQDHAGVIHSSNLCTEITLNTSRDETAVCNLGSINLERHVYDGDVDKDLLAETVAVAMRMLDNVVDLNFYPTVEAQNSNMKHRPVGLGLMGFQDALFKLDIPFESQEALTFSDRLMEFISYHAILTSSHLAKEKGAYESYKGSKWDRGIFPIDTLALLEKERGLPLEISKDSAMDWAPVREHVKKHGMRNSNCMAIAPTATISNISGCFPCIEPIYKNIYVKSNISGEFTVVNKYLIEDLKKLGLWNDEMLEQLKYYDGNVQLIAGIPQQIKDKYKEAFEMDPEWLIRITAARGRWIDQSQSHNIFMQGTSGKKLSDAYFMAWRAGLKTTYYLRTLAASQIEKSTLDANKYGFTQKREYTALEERKEEAPKVVVAGDICEACQ